MGTALNTGLQSIDGGGEHAGDGEAGIQERGFLLFFTLGDPIISPSGKGDLPRVPKNRRRRQKRRRKNRRA